MGWSAAVDDVPGIPSAGPLTEWLDPVARLAFSCWPSCTIGFWWRVLPDSSSRDMLSVAAARAARGTRQLVCFGLGGCGSGGSCSHPFGDLGASTGRDASIDVLTSYVTQVPQGASWLTSAALAVFTALAARESDRPLARGVPCCSRW